MRKIENLQQRGGNPLNKIFNYVESSEEVEKGFSLFQTLNLEKVKVCGYVKIFFSDTALINVHS